MSYNATPPSNSSVLHRKKYTHYPPSVPVRFYDCDECSDRFDGYHKLKRHRVGHMDTLQTKFNGDVVLEFPITPEKRVLCRCNKTVTISTMLNSHKYRCEACITEASDKLNRQETPPSPVQAPVKKSDINFILNPIESVPSLSSTVSTSSTAGSVVSDDLERVGFFFHQPTGLLICQPCKRAVINPRLREHFVICMTNPESERDDMPSDDDIDAARKYLRTHPRKVYNIKTAKKWVESLRGQAIEKIPELPVAVVSKCAICGYLCKTGTLKDHFTRAHRGIPSVPNSQVAMSQQLFSTIMLPKYVEVYHDQDMLPP